MNRIHFLLFSILIFLQLLISNCLQAQSLKYLQISGQITSKTTQEPLAFAHIGLQNNNIGSVTNIEGNFVFKIPVSKQNDSLQISYLGYEKYSMSLKEVDFNQFLKIELTPFDISLATIEVRADGALGILKEALKKIPENYPTEVVMTDAFYREQLLENEKFVILSEAVCEVRKSPYGFKYSKKSEEDQVRILKARKGEGLIDPEIAPFVINGGPTNGLESDILRNPDGPFEAKNFKYYDFELTNITTYNGHEVYIIDFDQKEEVKKSLFSGKIFIEVASLAIVTVEAGLSEKGLEYHKIPGLANRLILKVMGIQYTPIQMRYKIDYKKYGNKWYLHYTNNRFVFKLIRSKKGLTSIIDANADFLVTAVFPEKAVVNFSEEETFGSKDVLSQELGEYDAEFWKDYNVILPDEELKENVKKLDKNKSKTID
ncbi:MAG: carboxypeptidase-like regulatory domain-containing protein [Chitinophagales bacterium]